MRRRTIDADSRGRDNRRDDAMKMNGANFEALIGDLELALGEIQSLFEHAPDLWSRRVGAGWSAGQHADHVAAGLGATAESLEASERKLREGRLGPRPRRGPLQALFVAVAVGAGKFPRGGKSPRNILPTASPDRAEVFESLARETARHRALGERLGSAERDRLWIANPFLRRWHYAFPEVLRMQAVHLRHHAKGIREIASLTASV
jgi:hypothetical protein